MGEDDKTLNVSLDDIINKEITSRKRGGVGKRFSRGRGRGKSRGGGFRRRGRGRANLRPRSRPFGGFGGRRRGGRGGRRRGGFSRRRVSSEPEWRNDKYEERFHGSATSNSSKNYSSQTRNREPENFTTKSGLQVSTGSGSSNPDLNSSVQINGLHSNVQSEDLREILQKYGTVKYAYITYNENNESNGIGRACFVKGEHAKAAVKDLRDATIDGVSIKITFLGSGFDGGKERRNNFTSRRGRGGREDESDADMDDDDRADTRRRGRDSKNAPDTPFNPLAR